MSILKKRLSSYDRFKPFAKKQAKIPLPFTPSNIAVNSKINKIYATGNRNQLAIINGRTNRIVKQLNVGPSPAVIAINQRNNFVYVGNSVRRTVSVIHGKTNRLIKTIRLRGLPADIKINNNTNRVYISTFNSFGTNGVTVVNGCSNKIVSFIRIPNDFAGPLAVNPVTNRIYALGVLGNNVYVINGAVNRIISRINVSFSNLDDPTAIEVNPVTNRIYVLNLVGNRLVVINGMTNRVIKVVKFNNPIFAFAINPATNRIYVTIQRPSPAVVVLSGLTNRRIAVVPTGGVDVIIVDKKRNFIFVGNNAVTAITGRNNKPFANIVVGGVVAMAVNMCTGVLYTANSNRTIAVIKTGFKLKR
mgnify:CR=1 FL=1